MEEKTLKNVNLLRTSKKKTSQWIVGIVVCLFSTSLLLLHSISDFYVMNHEYSPIDFALYDHDTMYINSSLTDKLNENIDEVSFYSRLYRYARFNESDCMIYGTSINQHVEKFIDITNNQPYDQAIPYKHCLITQSFAHTHNISVGDTIALHSVYTTTLTVHKIVSMDLQSLLRTDQLVILSLPYMQSTFHISDQSNFIIGNLKRPQNTYNVMNMEKTIQSFRKIDERILEISNLEIYHPLIPQIHFSDSTILVYSIIITVITTITVLITSLTIFYMYSNKIYEYQKNTRILTEIGFSKKQIHRITSRKILNSLSLPFSIGLFLPICIGLKLNVLNSFGDISWYILSFFGSVFMLWKYNRKLKTENDYEIRKIQTKKYTIGLLGVLCLFTMIIILIVFPPLINSYNIIQSVPLISFLTTILVISVVCLFSITEKYILRLFSHLFRNKWFYLRKSLGNRKDHIASINLFTFFFIWIMIFTNSFISSNSETSVRLENGSDIKISPIHYNGIPQNVISDLENVEGIDISRIYYSNAEAYHDYQDSYDRIDETFRVYTGGTFQGIDCEIAGASQEYFDVIDHALISWERKMENALEKTLTNDSCCIISKVIATTLSISVGEQIKIQVSNSTHPIGILEKKTVVGIGRSFPAFNNFDITSTEKQGILLSESSFQNMTKTNEFCDSIIIKVTENTIENTLSQIYSIIDLSLYEIDVTQDKLEYINQNSINSYINIITWFSVILWGITNSIMYKKFERLLTSDMKSLTRIGMSRSHLKKYKYVEYGVKMVIGIGISYIMFIGSFALIVYYIDTILPITFTL